MKEVVIFSWVLAILVIAYIEIKLFIKKKKKL